MPYSPDHKKGTRDRILKAAAHQFNKKGFSEASIEEIMKAAMLIVLTAGVLLLLVGEKAHSEQLLRSYELLSNVR